MILIINIIKNLIKNRQGNLKKWLSHPVPGLWTLGLRSMGRRDMTAIPGNFAGALNKPAFFRGLLPIRDYWVSKLTRQKMARPKIVSLFPALRRGNPGFPALLLLACLGVVSCNNSPGNSNPKDKKEVVAKSVDSAHQTKTILFFGNSLTAGYGVEPAEAYPALVQKKIDSLGLKYKVVNAGVSGETTAGGNSRVDWILKQPLDIFVLELGANDGLRGIPLATTEQNLQSIIDKVKKAYPQAKVFLEGMQIPPNMGADYATQFRDIYPRLANKNNLILIPFLLKDVAGDPGLNQSDGIHPTAEGYKIVVENVWEVLKKEL